MVFCSLVGSELYSQGTWKSADFCIFKSESNKHSIEELVNGQHLFESVTREHKSTRPADIYWLRIDFSNNLGTLLTDSIWYFRFKPIDFGELYISRGSILTKIPIGRYNKDSKSQKKGAFMEIILEGNTLIDNKYVYIKAREVSSFERLSDWRFDCISAISHSDIETYKTQTPLFVFLGICFIIFVFTFFYYLYFKQTYFLLFYALYLALISLYLSFEPLGLDDWLFDKNNIASLKFTQSVKIIFNIVYIWFSMNFIDVAHRYRFIYFPLIFVMCCDFLLMLLNLYMLHEEFYLVSIYINHFHHIFLIILIAVFCITYVSINSKDALSYILCIAAFFYTASFFFQYYLSAESSTIQLFKENNYFLLIGFTIEIIFYTFGFIYKTLLDYTEKLKYQKEAVINKNKALRAQINPHFIFNALNSIQHLITSENKVSALSYLTKFGRLTRNVLESSMEPDILLSEEINILTDYLELETLRFQNSFKYTVDIAPDVNVEEIEIPILIIQPFVENAIVHGLLNKKEGERLVQIRFRIEDLFLICEVEDNGIGRGNAPKKSFLNKKKSRGLQVTKERLNMYHNSNSKIELVTIIDKKSEDGKPLGTLVIIRIPFDRNLIMAWN